MEIKDLLKKPLPSIPPEIAASLIKSEITKTPFHQKNDILSDVELQKIKSCGVNAKTERLMITLAEYYIANKEPDSD